MYDLHARDEDEIDEVIAPSHVSLETERRQVESGTVSLGSAVAGLALIGLTIGALSVAGAVKEQRRSRRDDRRQRSRAEHLAAPPGWYELDDGRLRWWDGSDWTAHFQAAPSSEGAPAGWYDDGSGRQRWWDGIAWTQHFQPARALASGTPQASGHGFTESTSKAMDVTNDVPRISMSSVEWA